MHCMLRVTLTTVTSDARGAGSLMTSSLDARARGVGPHVVVVVATICANAASHPHPHLATGLPACLPAGARTHAAPPVSARPFKFKIGQLVGLHVEEGLAQWVDVVVRYTLCHRDAGPPHLQLPHAPAATHLLPRTAHGRQGATGHVRHTTPWRPLAIMATCQTSAPTSSPAWWPRSCSPGILITFVRLDLVGWR